MSIPASSLISRYAGATPQKPNSKFNGVQIGVQTYSYRSLRNFDDRSRVSLAKQKRLVDVIVDDIAKDNINSCEFWIALIEPYSVPHDYGNGGEIPSDPRVVKARELLRQWRASRPMEIFTYAREKFKSAGVDIYAAMYNFNESCTDDEIEAGFDMAKALGTDIITANPTVASMKRVAPFADKYKVRVGAHNHNFSKDPNELATPESLIAVTQLSPYIYVTLDIGHFVAGGGDPVSFLRAHHNKVINLHLKDRYKNDSRPHSDENVVEWGKGNTPIKEVLQLMAREKYPFPATIEYEYKGRGTPVEEVKRCLEYAKAALQNS